MSKYSHIYFSDRKHFILVIDKKFKQAGRKQVGLQKTFIAFYLLKLKLKQNCDKGVSSRPLTLLHNSFF